MDKSDRIYIARRPRLGLDRPTYTWRMLGWLCLACAAVSALAWWKFS